MNICEHWESLSTVPSRCDEREWNWMCSFVWGCWFAKGDRKLRAWLDFAFHPQQHQVVLGLIGRVGLKKSQALLGCDLCGGTDPSSAVCHFHDPRVPVLAPSPAGSAEMLLYQLSCLDLSDHPKCR